MRTFINISRFIIGTLFIFSGLIKANDPLGLSYKMQEFFEVWNLHQFNDYTLTLSVIMIAFEIIAGVAVLLGWKMRIFSWLLLALILFFTVVFSFAFQWYVLQHLPVVDCLPYKIGNNIPEKMRIPAGAVPDSTVIVFTYEKNGKQSSFTTENFPADFDDSYKFIKREDKVVRKGTAVPAIRDFSLQTTSGTDTTQALLTEPGTKIFLFLKDGYLPGEWIEQMDMIIGEASKKNIKGFLVTNLDVPDNRQGFMPELQTLKTDGTAIKTAARYNPTLFLIKDGTILKKWSAVDFAEALRYLGKL